MNIQEVVFNKGDLVKAMRASFSVPGVFVPVENNGRFLIDGGVMDNLPIEILKENGAEIIIAVNLDKDNKQKRVYEEANQKKDQRRVVPGILSTLQVSFNILMKEKTNIFLKNPQENVIIISPDLKEVKFQDFKKVDLAVKKGEEGARKELHLIKQLYN